MTNQTTKQLKATLTNEIAKRFKAKINNLETRIEDLASKYTECDNARKKLHEENSALKDENTALKNEITQYKEWIERMQDFCNLPEKEREVAFKTYLDEIKSKNEAEKSLSALTSLYLNFSNILFK